MLVCFSKQLKDTHSSNVKGRMHSPKGSLEEMWPTPCHMPANLKERHAREYVRQSIHVFSLEEFEV